MRRTVVVLIVLLLSVIAFISPATAATAPTISTKDQTALKALGIKIAVPTYVPTGYTVKKVEVEPCSSGERSPKGTCRFGPAYSIAYRNAVPKDSCFFAIRATGGGVGGSSGEYRTPPVSTRLLGDVAVLFGKSDNSAKVPSAAQLNSPQPGLMTDWGSEDGGNSGPFYGVIGHPEKPAPECQNTITPNEVTKIVQSLTWLE